MFHIRKLTLRHILRVKRNAAKFLKPKFRIKVGEEAVRMFIGRHSIAIQGRRAVLDGFQDNGRTANSLRPRLVVHNADKRRFVGRKIGMVEIVFTCVVSAFFQAKIDFSISELVTRE